MSTLKLDEIKSLQGTGNTVITFNSSDKAVFASQPVIPVPAFRGYLSTDQSISSSTETKVNIDTVTGDNFFDTHGWFDTTNYRYTPQIPGYYFVMGNIRTAGTNPSVQYVSIFKNGAQYEVGEIQRAINTVDVVVSSLVYMNGSTDYVELYGFITATSPTFDYASNSAGCFFSGFLVRAA
jgi:hypothetical protein